MEKGGRSRGARKADVLEKIDRKSAGECKISWRNRPAAEGYPARQMRKPWTYDKI